MKNRSFSLRPVAALVALACAPAAFAQTQPVESTLPAVVVKVPSPIIESNLVDSQSAFSTRVSDEQVRQLGALDLAAALRMTPGVQISRYNEVGSYSGDQGGNVYIRGLGASRPGGEVKTYLDGIPLYMGLWNHPLMDLLPLQGIQAIRVHKGPVNPVAGNNFASIDLESKRAKQEGVHGDVNASIGSFSTRVLQGNLQGKQGPLDFALSMGHASSEGDRENADARLKNAMGRLGYQIDANWSVGLSFLSVDNKVGDPGDERYVRSTSGVGPYQFSNGVARNHSTSNLLAASVAHRHGDWQGELKVYRNEGHNNLEQDPSWGTFDSTFSMSGFTWQEAFVPWQGARVSAGLDQQSITGSITGPNVGAAVGTPFAFGQAGSAEISAFRLSTFKLSGSQDIALSSDWVLRPSLGVRFYDSNHHGSKAAPNAGLSLITGWGNVYAQYAEGLLYPGAETYTLTRAIPMAFAADNGWDRLKPSKNRHTEIGVQWDVATGTHLDVSAFQDDISDRYVWSGFVPNATATWSNNFPDYQVRGAEVSLKHELCSAATLFGGFTWLNPSLSSLPYAPRRAASLGLSGVAAGLRWSTDVQHQSDMISLTQSRELNKTGNPVDGFTVVNARVAYPVSALGKQGEVYLALNNLFDKAYAYNAGYPMPGRNFRVGLSASF